jgi:class 3 adenylate cyclase
VRLGGALREEMAELTPQWQKRGYDLDVADGIALGHATCREVGFEGRSDYAAIGAVANLASRLADEAAAGQILISQRLYAEVEDDVGGAGRRVHAEGVPAAGRGIQRRRRPRAGRGAVLRVELLKTAPEPRYRQPSALTKSAR